LLREQRVDPHRPKPIVGSKRESAEYALGIRGSVASCWQS